MVTRLFEGSIHTVLCKLNNRITSKYICNWTVLIFNFRGKKLNLSDFGHFYRSDQYFVNGEADIAQLGTDVYSLCGMASTNLALNVRLVDKLFIWAVLKSGFFINFEFSVPNFTKRLMDGSSRVTRESVRRALMQQMEKHADDPTVFLDELSHLVHDMHDYQQLSKKVSRGKYELGLVWLFVL